MKGLRTMLINAAIAAGTAGMAMIDPALLTEALGSKWGPAIIIGINVINMLLRANTNTPIGRKE